MIVTRLVSGFLLSGDLLKSLHASEGKVENFFYLKSNEVQLLGTMWPRSPHNSVLPSASHLGSVREYKLGKKNKAKCSVLLLKLISFGLYLST